MGVRLNNQVGRMKARLSLVLCGTFALCACATAPRTPAGVPVDFIGCSSAVRDPGNLGGDPTVALLVLGVETGYDIAAYGTCAVERLVHPGSTGALSGGVYRSGRGTFSVALLTPPPSMQKPSIGILQPTVLPSESVLIRPLDDGKPVMMSGLVEIGAAISHETELQQSSTLEQAGLEEMQHQTGLTTEALLHQEPVILDGRSALFAIYSVRPSRSDSPSQLHYLFTYFTRYQHDSAALAVFWSGDCAVCTEGHETDIRKLDSDIGRVVDSFHLDEAALQAWDSGDAKPADQPAPPALPRIPVPAGQALVYFYREYHLIKDRGLDYSITEDDKEFGTLTNGTYLHVLEAPGSHSFGMTASGYKSECQVQLKSGDVRYLEVYVSQPAIGDAPLALSCRESSELQTRVKMADVKESTEE